MSKVLFDSKTSQVLSHNEEEQLVDQVTKMGENGPVIYDRHFFTLVWRCKILPNKNPNLICCQDIDRQQENNFEWINFVREPVSRMVSWFNFCELVLNEILNWIKIEKQIHTSNWICLGILHG